MALLRVVVGVLVLGSAGCFMSEGERPDDAPPDDPLVTCREFPPLVGGERCDPESWGPCFGDSECRSVSIYCIEGRVMVNEWHGCALDCADYLARGDAPGDRCDRAYSFGDCLDCSRGEIVRCVDGVVTRVGAIGDALPPECAP